MQDHTNTGASIMVTREDINMARFRATVQAQRKAMCKTCTTCTAVGLLVGVLTVWAWL